MEAATLNCPMCGAASATDATSCGHCGARLATVACPSCFGMIFLGSKFCQHCGTKIERKEGADALPKSCPRCVTSALKSVVLGTTTVRECPKCEGLWVDVAAFNAICADREKQAAVISQMPAVAPVPIDISPEGQRYIKCNVCGTLMNRVNFAHNSGVIIDICKPHGVWFDRDELRRIVEFIRNGGLEASRKRDLDNWEAEKRKNAIGPINAGGTIMDSNFVPPPLEADDLLSVIARVAWDLWR